MKLKTLPMTNVMYLRLVNKIFSTTAACCNCSQPNGECVHIALEGKCNACISEMNKILVFHDGCYEFATTRQAISHALKVNQENEENPWIGQTVDAVIEDYMEEAKSNFGKENVLASILFELLSTSDIITSIDHYKLEYGDD